MTSEQTLSSFRHVRQDSLDSHFSDSLTVITPVIRKKNVINVNSSQFSFEKTTDSKDLKTNTENENVWQNSERLGFTFQRFFNSDYGCNLKIYIPVYFFQSYSINPSDSKLQDDSKKKKIQKVKKMLFTFYVKTEKLGAGAVLI